MSIAPDRRGRPELIAFDVNETLSDMSPMAARFEAVGAPGHLAAGWFAGLLRDAFALTVAGENPSFAELGADGLRVALAGASLNRPADEAVEHVMAGFAELAVHPDVPVGIAELHELGIRLVTLSNGSASVARRLLTDAGLDHAFESFLSVEQAGIWKPAPGAYAHALTTCQVDPADAMLVAVHPWDIDGAARAGLSTAWINRKDSPYPDYFRQPDLEAASLSQLAEQLR
jgi:2-haloacid dehalogenase